MDIQKIREQCAKRHFIWKKHCLERMQEREISRAEVFQVIQSGEIIEDYPNDYPFPSCLTMGFTTENRVLHIVIGFDGDLLYFITVYVPDTETFESDLKTRKAKK